MSISDIKKTLGTERYPISRQTFRDNLESALIGRSDYLDVKSLSRSEFQRGVPIKGRAGAVNVGPHPRASERYRIAGPLPVHDHDILVELERGDVTFLCDEIHNPVEYRFPE